MKKIIHKWKNKKTIKIKNKVIKVFFFKFVFDLKIKKK